MVPLEDALSQISIGTKLTTHNDPTQDNQVHPEEITLDRFFKKLDMSLSPLI